MLSRKSAFTLVELLMVIIIVGILAAVSIPMIVSNVERAKWTEAVTTLGMIRRARRAYKVEFGDDPTVSYYLNGGLKNCPPSLDLSIPDPDAEGRYIYVIRPKGSYPDCAYAVHDKNNTGYYNPGEPIIDIYLDGHFTSGNGAPEF